MRYLIAPIFLATLLGCPQSDDTLPPTMDAEPEPMDASFSDIDAMEPDANVVDSGPTEDTGIGDSGVLDSGPQDSGPTEDTGIGDSGPTEDTGIGDSGPTEDTGIGDSGPTEDTGIGDSGVLDSGPQDSGSRNDAGGADSGSADTGCAFGEISSTATTGQVELFGEPVYFAKGETLPAGTYRATYVDGCMKYAGNQGWTVNARNTGQNSWFAIGETTDIRFAMLPGNVGFLFGRGGAHANFEDCVEASLKTEPVEFKVVTPSRVGVWLEDNPYSDNVPGIDNRNPSWRLDRIDGDCE